MGSHLRSMLGRLQTALQKMKTKRPALVFFAFLVLIGVAFIVHPTLAIDSKPTGEAGWFVSALSWIMLTIANIALQLTIFFLRFFIMLASYNNFIDVDVVQLGWIMVRDLANMFFVIALLVIAFGTILGLEEYEWKKNLVKLILSAIVINFSNLIAQLIIDVAHVFTITFLNAISATAGGNVINMLKLDQVTKLATGDTGSIDLELFAASVVAMLFALMAAAAMGSYLVVMMYRVVALWGLIILSPLAFVLGVLPKTKSYAEKWWSEFSKYVIVAPIMVFFLWLSFATLGLGNIAEQIQNTGIAPNNQLNQTGFEGQVSIAKVSSWENMANFFLAFVFMMYGIKATQETGVEGAGAISSAVDFGKSVAKYASGYAAARWVGGKVRDAAGSAVSGIGQAAYDLTLANRVERTGNWFKKQYAGLKDYRNAGPMIEKKFSQGEAVEVGDNYQLSQKEELQGWQLKKNEKTKKMEMVAGQDIYDVVRDAEGKPQFRSWFQKRLYDNQLKLTQSRKELEKVENSAERRQEMMDKSIEAQPSYLMKSRLFGKTEINKDLDRIEMGMLEAMEERSSAKSGEFKSQGRSLILANKRYKTESKGGGLREAAAALIPIFGGNNLESRYQDERDTVIEQIAVHETRKETVDKQIAAMAAVAKNRYLNKGGKALVQGKIKAELELKAQESQTSKLEALAKTKVLDTDKSDILGRAIAAEKAAHLESIKHEKKEKAADRKFLESEHGRLELEEEADLHNEIGEIQNVIDGLTTEAKNRITVGEGGLTDEEIHHEAHGNKKKEEDLLKKRAALQAGYQSRSQAFVRSQQDLKAIKDEEKAVTEELLQGVKDEDQKKKAIKEKAISDAFNAASAVQDEAGQKKAFADALKAGLKAGAEAAGTGDHPITIKEADIQLTEADERAVNTHFKGQIAASRIRSQKEKLDADNAANEVRQSAVDELKRVKGNIDGLNERSAEIIKDPAGQFKADVAKIVEKIKADEKEIGDMLEAGLDEAKVGALRQAEIAAEAAPADQALVEKLIEARKAVAEDAKTHGLTLEEDKIDSGTLEESLKQAKKTLAATRRDASLKEAQKAVTETLADPGLLTDATKSSLGGISSSTEFSKRLQELTNDTAALGHVAANSQKVSINLRKQAEDELEKVVKRFKDDKDFGRASDLIGEADALRLELDVTRLAGLDQTARDRIFKFKPYAADLKTKTEKGAIGRDLSVMVSKGILSQADHDSLQAIVSDDKQDVGVLRSAVFAKFKDYESYQNLADKYGKEGDVPPIDELIKKGKTGTSATTALSDKLGKKVAEDTKILAEAMVKYREQVQKAYVHAVEDVHHSHPHLSQSQVDGLVENPDRVQAVYLGGILKKTAAERSMRAGKRAHTADMYGKAIEKKIEQQDALSHDGQHEIELDAVYENEAEAMDSFVKNLKNSIIKDKFKKASDQIQKIISTNAGNRKEMLKALNALADSQKDQASYVRKLRNTVFARLGEEDFKQSTDLAEEAAEAGFYEIQRFNKATPSTAMDGRISNAAKDLKGLEAQDGGAMAARWVASIMRQRRGLQNQGRDIDDDSKARLFAAITHITNEAWTDDTIAEISSLFQDLDSGKINLNTDEGRDVQEMKEIFVNQLGLIKKNNQGEYKSYSDPKNSAALQALVATGGDLDFVNSHNWVGVVTDSLKTKDYAKKSTADIKKDLSEKLNVKAGDTASEADLDKIIKLIQSQQLNAGSGYEDVAKVLADEAKVLTKFKIDSFAKFNKALDDKQELLQEASSQFKRAALNAKHLQNGGHQAYDARWGGSGRYRLMTIGESQAIMKAETVKREGMQNAQHHSYGTIDNNTGRLVGIDPKMFAILTASILDAQKANVLTRTMDNLMGYGSGQAFKKTEKGMSILGGGVEQMRELMKDFVGPNATDAEVSAKYFERMIKPALKSNAQGFQLLFSKKNSIAQAEANRGRVNIAFELGNGKTIEAANYSAFLQRIKENFSDQFDSEFDESYLNNLIESYKRKERSNLSNNKGKKNAREEEDEIT